MCFPLSKEQKLFFPLLVLNILASTLVAKDKFRETF